MKHFWLERKEKHTHEMMWRQWGTQIKVLDLLSRNLNNSANSVDNKVTLSVKCTTYVTTPNVYEVQLHGATVLILSV